MTATVIRWTGRTLLLLLVAAIVAAITVLMVLPRAVQGQAMTVLTASMAPAIPAGSIVVVRPVDPETLDVGDVATFQKAPGREVFITHRVLEVDRSTDPTMFVFKGDANRGADVDPVPAGAIRGEVWFHVPYLGTVRDGIYGQGGITAAIMILLAAYAASQLYGGVRERRQARGKAPEVDRSVVLVRLDRARLTEQLGFDVEQAAHRWIATVVAEDESSATLLLAPRDASLLPTVELLAGLDPLALEVWQAPVKVAGAPPSGAVKAALAPLREPGARAAEAPDARR